MPPPPTSGVLCRLSLQIIHWEGGVCACICDRSKRDLQGAGGGVGAVEHLTLVVSSTKDGAPLWVFSLCGG